MNIENTVSNAKSSVSLTDDADDETQSSRNKVCFSKNKISNSATSQSELKQFANEKKQTLEKMDKSIKGEIDAPIVCLVNLINSNFQYYTTSSCSGRIIVTATNNQEELQRVMKKGTDWQFVSHEPIAHADSFLQSINEAKNSEKAYNWMVLKFEPVIFHIRAINISAANRLLQVALQSGFRNSGIVLGANGRFTVAIRHTAGLEVPLIIEGEMTVQEDYLRQLVKVANLKMDSNEHVIKRLETAVKAFFNVENQQ